MNSALRSLGKSGYARERSQPKSIYMITIPI